MRNILWDQCQAHAEYLDPAGEQFIVICTLPSHCDISDDTAEHEDERLGIKWRYSYE